MNRASNHTSQDPPRTCNTIVTVIARLQAASSADAYAKLARSVEMAGFDVYCEGAGPGDAFEAEEGTTIDDLPSRRAR
jgi:hypothetical protein